MGKEGSADKSIREIRRRTRREFSAEEKIRIMIEGRRGEESICAKKTFGRSADGFQLSVDGQFAPYPDLL